MLIFCLKLVTYLLYLEKNKKGRKANPLWQNLFPGLPHTNSVIPQATFIKGCYAPPIESWLHCIPLASRHVCAHGWSILRNFQGHIIKDNTIHLVVFSCSPLDPSHNAESRQEQLACNVRESYSRWFFHFPVKPLQLRPQAADMRFLCWVLSKWRLHMYLLLRV